MHFFYKHTFVKNWLNPKQVLTPHSSHYIKQILIKLFNHQGSRTSISNHPNNADTSILAEQLLRERDRAEELANRMAKLKEELSEANLRETDVRYLPSVSF